MMTFFIVLQFCLLFFMLFHDLIPIPPFNDVAKLKKIDGNWGYLRNALINSLFVIVPLYLTLKYKHSIMPFSALTTIIGFYCGLTIGTIMSWWLPYFFRSSEKHKQLFKKFNNTHHFLPKRGDNVIPNTLHVILHLQVWTCFLISVYFFISYR